MSRHVLWDETKRQANLDKHGLDFLDAVMVLESPYRLDVESVRGSEERTQSFAYVFDVLAVLTVVHVARTRHCELSVSDRRVKRKGALTMAGSKMTSTATTKMRAALKRGESKTDVAKVRARTPYAWDGKNEDERPLTREEMQAGIEAYRRQRGRPAGSDKESTTIRFDRDVLTAFRAGGPGWQTRMNAALREWLKTHSSA